MADTHPKEKFIVFAILEKSVVAIRARAKA